MNDLGLGPLQVAAVISYDDDGGVTIQLPRPKVKRPKVADADAFNENLALDDSLDLAGIASEVIGGVDADLASRSQFLGNYTKGLDLLGLELKDDKNDKTSKVGHPLLLEAIIKAQSSAGAELMPAGGPCKVETNGGADAQSDEMAREFAEDLNWYLTKGAPEYYPDTDRGLFGLFYSGNMFKKVYRHPLRRRPVSETVAIEDLIVSQEATDLDTAIRVTHRSMLSNPEIARMQRFADWRDVSLPDASPIKDQPRLAQANLVGMAIGSSTRPQDQPHEIYETTIDLDLSDYGHDEPGAPDIPISYIVTVDKDSRQVLAVRRGWKRDDDQFRRKRRFVHYGMVPAFDFLCLGFVHLLGNQTQVLRGIWRLLVTSGMFANSPGGIKAKGVKMSQNDAQIGPGDYIDIDLAGTDDLRKAFMPMPYRDVSPEFMKLAESIGGDAMRMAGTPSTDVGEGKSNVPVGTMMSMIEMATQTMSAVHKRLHRAQADELDLLRSCFVDDPEALTKLNPRPNRKWSAAEEFMNLSLLPASDPNVPSQIHRIQLATAMITVAQQNPDLYDRIAIHKRAWTTIGVADADAFLLDQPAPPPPGKSGTPNDPQIGQAKLMEAQARIEKVKQDQIDLQRKAATDQVKTAHQEAKMQLDAESDAKDRATKEKIEAGRLEIERIRLQIEQLELQQQLHRGQMDTEMGIRKMAIDSLTKRHVADAQAEAALTSAKMHAETARHTAKVSSDTARHVAKMKPKPAAKK